MNATVTRTKIVYLLGAGATHAELMNLYFDMSSDGNFLDQNSLLLEDVSKRVCRGARKEGDFKGIGKLLAPVGLSNIELFIGLIEKNRIGPADLIQKLKKRMQRDIQDRLTASRRKKFYLHKALLEMHERDTHEEELTGIISLNYDRVIDEAYGAVFAKEPDYCLSFDRPYLNIPLLKLHGGFGLKQGETTAPVITPGINKNYLELPYNFIWGRALELLIKCDVLRVIGCSLSQNDLGLIDLLFKAHIKRRESFTVQLIDFDPENNRVKEQYGFLSKI